MLVGGSESSSLLCHCWIPSFDGYQLQEVNKVASIPFDEKKTVAAVLSWEKGLEMLVLESLEHAQQLGATILAEVAGWPPVMLTIWLHLIQKGHAIKAMKLSFGRSKFLKEQVTRQCRNFNSANEKGENESTIVADNGSTCSQVLWGHAVLQGQ